MVRLQAKIELVKSVGSKSRTQLVNVGDCDPQPTPKTENCTETLNSGEDTLIKQKENSMKKIDDILGLINLLDAKLQQNIGLTSLPFALIYGQDAFVNPDMDADSHQGIVTRVFFNLAKNSNSVLVAIIMVRMLMLSRPNDLQISHDLCRIHITSTPSFERHFHTKVHIRFKRFNKCAPKI